MSWWLLQSCVFVSLQNERRKWRNMQWEELTEKFKKLKEDVERGTCKEENGNILNRKKAIKKKNKKKMKSDA